MDKQHLSAPTSAPIKLNGRRTVAVGFIRRSDGRTTTLTATSAGASGSIRPAVKR